MKQIFSFLLLFSLNLSAQDFGQKTNVTRIYEDSDSIQVNYLPLHTGNIWQYLGESGIYTSSYKLDTIRVLFDTVINDKKYFKLSNFKDLIRYSETEKKIYLHWNDSDYLHIDFNILPGNNYQALSTTHHNYTVLAVGGVINLFGRERVFGGYKYFGQAYENKEFTDSIGITRQLFDNYYSIYGTKILQAIIYDSSGVPRYFSYHYKPEITLNPINETDSAEFKLTFQVDHENSIPYYKFNFIDRVHIESFYSKKSSIIPTRPLPAINTPGTSNVYSISTVLDTALLKNGYIFNYRIYASDKGIIREFSLSPDSGFYQCIWNELLSNKEKDVPLSYKLYQNRPNPFNPSTLINYSIPSLSNVSLKIFDALGREVEILVNEEKHAGSYEQTWNAENLPSGIYFYRIQAGSFVETKKMILVK